MGGHLWPSSVNENKCVENNDNDKNWENWWNDEFMNYKVWKWGYGWKWMKEKWIKVWMTMGVNEVLGEKE